MIAALRFRAAPGDITREKRASTLRARSALAGVQMHAIVDDHGRQAYLLTRGPMTREFASLDAVDEFLSEGGA